MKKSIRITSILLCAILVVLMLVGCSKEESVPIISADMYYDIFDQTIVIKNDDYKIWFEDERSMYIEYKKDTMYNHVEGLEADTFKINETSSFIEVIMVRRGIEQVIFKVNN